AAADGPGLGVVGGAGGVGAVGAVALLAGVHLGHHGGVAVGVEVLAGVVLVVGADVAGLLGALALFVVGLEHGALNHLAAGRVDRVGDVGMQLGPAVGVAGGAILVELAAALVAE